MAISADQLALSARVKQALLATRYTITYGALARDLDVTGAGSIARIAQALESLMQDDMAAGRPFLAAMCEGRLAGGLPALGFFQMARALGRYAGPDTGPQAAAFVAQQRAALGVRSAP